jgi:hypothetical protein
MSKDAETRGCVFCQNFLSDYPYRGKVQCSTRGETDRMVVCRDWIKLGKPQHLVSDDPLSFPPDIATCSECNHWDRECGGRGLKGTCDLLLDSKGKPLSTSSTDSCGNWEEALLPEDDDADNADVPLESELTPADETPLSWRQKNEASVRPPVIKSAPKFSVKMSLKTFHSLLYVGRLSAPNEVQFLAEVERSQDGLTFSVGEVFLLNQEVSGGSAVFDPSAIAVLVAGHPHPEKLRGWIHSHVNMGCFWSGTDEGTIMTLSNAGWLLSLVFTISGDIKARLDFSFQKLYEEMRKEPSRPEISAHLDDLIFLPDRYSWDSVPIEIEEFLSGPDKARLKAEFEEKVKTARVEVSVTARKQGTLFGGKFVTHDSNRYPSLVMPASAEASPYETTKVFNVDCFDCMHNTGGEVCRKGHTRGWRDETRHWEFRPQEGGRPFCDGYVKEE